MLFPGKGIVGLLLVYVFLVKFEIDKTKRPTITTVGSILVTMLVGYFFVYIMSPHDHGWHLATSLKETPVTPLAALPGPSVFLIKAPFH